MRTILFLFLVIIINQVCAQTPNTHFDIESTDKGILIPRLDSSVRNAIIPNLNETSLLVYDNDLKQFMFWDGVEWSQIGNKDQYVFPEEGNVIVGSQAAQNRIPNDSNGDGKFNIILGNLAGNDLTTARSNVLIGHVAAKDLKHGFNNVIIGSNAGANIDTTNNLVAIGALSGRDNKASFNTYVGSFAGRDNQTGISNTFVGYAAGQMNTTTNNAFFGTSAGANNTTGNRNTLIGKHAGRNNETGFFNTFLGTDTGWNNITGYRNTYLGQDAGRSQNGNFNIMIGQGSGYHPDSVWSVSNSIFIGPFTGKDVDQSNQLIIESGDQGNPLIQGDFVQNTLNLNAKVFSHTFQLKKFATEPNACNSATEGQLYYDNSTSPGKAKLCTINGAGFSWVDLN